jgi:N-methylhydantoinase B
LRLPSEATFTPVDLVRQEVPAGTTAMIVTAGGGGWGDPLERDPARVAVDVLEELVSREAARDQYGVVFKPDALEVDLPATAARRAELARLRKAFSR